MKKTLFFIIAAIIAGCSNESSKTGNSDADKFFDLNFEEALSNKKAYPLSEIASGIQYIKLETNDSCLLRPVVRYFFTDDFIFVRNFDHILKFSREGKFLQRIGKSGRGPGEIDLIRSMSVIPEKRLIVVQLNYQRKLYYFSFDGEFLKEIDFDRNVSYIKVCQDGKYILQERGAGGYEKYSFCLTTDTWDTLSHVENYTKWENKSNMVISIGYPSFESFYEVDGKMHMKDMYNDTIYYVDDTRLKPAYFLNMGEFRLPGDLRPEKLGPDMISQFNENSGKYFFGTLHEAAGKIFLAAHCYKDAPSRYVVFDKATGTATYLSDGNEPAKGFIDDLNGITEIWPIGSAGENQVFMPVSVMSLQKQIKENAARTARFPEKQKELEQMIMAMDPTDNPLLVLMTLK